jgi:hypothetical protein
VQADQTEDDGERHLQRLALADLQHHPAAEGREHGERSLVGKLIGQKVARTAPDRQPHQQRADEQQSDRPPRDGMAVEGRKRRRDGEDAGGQARVTRRHEQPGPGAERQQELAERCQHADQVADAEPSRPTL